MTRLIRAYGVMLVFLLTGSLLSPCQTETYAQTREEQIYCLTQGDCSDPQCQWMDECPQGPVVLPGESEPTCCGSGVDCRCDWYGGDPAFLDDGDRYCTGWSACCGHDQCCRDSNWFVCVTHCWVAAGTYC